MPSEADKRVPDPGATDSASDPHQVARTALGGLILATAVAALALYAAFATRSFVVAGATLHLALGALVWGFVLLSAQRETRASAEALETQRLEALAAEGRQALFGGRSGTGPESSGLERFRSGGHALLTLLLSAAAIGGGVYLGWRYPLSEVRPSLGIAASLGAAAFALLLLGRYAFAIARRGLLAAGARRALSGAGVSLLACLALAAQFKGLEQADFVGYGLVAVEILLGVAARSRARPSTAASWASSRPPAKSRARSRGPSTTSSGSRSARPGSTNSRPAGSRQSCSS